MSSRISPKLAVLLVCASSALPSAHATECGPEFRLDKDGGPMQHVPVLDQGKIGSCYAYAGAQMLDAWRFSHGVKPDGRNILPETLAVDSLPKDSNRANIDGGDTLPVLQAGLAGTCVNWKGDPQALQDWLKTAGNRAAYSSTQIPALREDEQLLKKLEDPAYCAALAKEGSDPELLKANCLHRIDFRSKALADNKIKISSECMDMARQGGATPEAISRLKQDLYAILDAGGFTPLTPVKMIREAVACSPENRIEIPEPKPTPKTHEFNVRDKSGREAWLNEYFSKHQQPLEIDFCARLLDRGQGRDYKFVGFSRENCGMHAALIIGRRKTFFGRCQYLIRNSWGKRCDRYSFDWDCENGNIWVDEETLAPNTFATTWLEN